MKANSYSKNRDFVFLWGISNLDEFLETIENLILQHPEDSDLHYIKAYRLSKYGRHEESIKSIEEALGKRNNKRRHMFYQLKGKVLCAKEMYSEAITVLEDAAKICPVQEGWYYNNIGDIYFKRNMYDDALKNFEKARKLRKDDFYADLQMGLCFREKKEYEQAIYHLDIAIKLFEENKDKNTKRNIDYDAQKQAMLVNKERAMAELNKAKEDVELYAKNFVYCENKKEEMEKEKSTDKSEEESLSSSPDGNEDKG